jgi:hypothetical protein
MAQGSDRSVFRLMFWDSLAVAGLVYIRLHPQADPTWDQAFFYNALFFLVAFPVLFVYRWKMTDGCLPSILWPLSFALSAAVGVSCYLWVAYILLMTGSPYSGAMTQHYVTLGILFAIIYFTLGQALLGVGKNYQALGQLVWVLFYSALGGFIGYETGWFVSQKFPSVQIDHSHWLLLWLGITLLGVAIGSLLSQKRGK